MTDVKTLNRGEGWVICRFVKSLCCTPEINVTLYLNYTSISKKREKMVFSLLADLRSTGLKGITWCHLVVKAVSAVQEPQTSDANIKHGRKGWRGPWNWPGQPWHPMPESFNNTKPLPDHAPQRRHSLQCPAALAAEKLIELPPSTSSALDLLPPSSGWQGAVSAPLNCILRQVNTIDSIKPSLVSVC